MGICEEALSWEKSKLQHQYNIYTHMKFQILKLFMWRFRKLKNKNYKYLNLGGVEILGPTYCSANISAPLNLIFKKKLNFWSMDASKPWLCPDNYWEGIFSSHMLEHLSYAGAINSLKEAYRTIKPGGLIRIVLPDLGKYIRYYNGMSPNNQFERFRSGAIAISVLTQNAGHFSVWDFTLLSDVLSEIGWKNIERVGYKQGANPDLFLDIKERDWASFYLEAKK